MLPVVIPGLDFKKDYNFCWKLQSNDATDVVGTFYYEEQLKLQDILSNFNTAYLAQLCQSVNLPKDGFNTDKVKIGPLEIPYIKGKKIEDIVVTYLEDTSNFVYNLHREWQDLAHNSDHETMSFNVTPLRPISAKGIYIDLDTSVTASELYTILNSPNIQGTFNSSMLNLFDAYAHPTQIQMFSHIFPIDVERTNPNKEGSGLSTVTVTYTRIPVINRMHEALESI